MSRTAFLKSTLMLTVALGLTRLPADAQRTPVNDSQRTRELPEIIVHGDGEVMAAPDEAVVRLGVEAQSQEAAAAQNSVNEVIAKALGNLARLGIPTPSIQTTSIGLYPVYSPQQPGRESEPPRVVGYRASNTLQVRVSDLKLVGQVIDAAMAAGVNRLEGVSFTLRDDLAQRTAALRKAVAEAQAKARAIAETLAVRIVGVSEVTEGGVNVIRPMQSYGMPRLAAAAATPVEPGELRVQASVTVRYRIASADSGATSVEPAK